MAARVIDTKAGASGFSNTGVLTVRGPCPYLGSEARGVAGRPYCGTCVPPLTC